MTSDEQLLKATAAARGAAHRAPLAEWSKDHLGHSSIVYHTHAWADRSNEFSNLVAEIKRRGLEIPACDCPVGTHEVSP
jgi:hypothetical protein